ncbi:hypothetical protein GGH93_000744 [Coemansia aciculifera]|nr:hypothetical protein GGH93_000744 [Coemansia aciculifera]
MPESSTPNSNPNIALQLVFDYLSPIPGPDCSSTELLAHLHCLQRVAAVNREWRAVALLLFYRVAYVVIGRPVDTHDADDSDDDNMAIDDEGQSEGEDNDDNMSVNNEEQSEADSVDGGDNWDSDNDEELLNTVGLSRNSVRIRHRNNIGLLSAAGLIEKVHDVQTAVQGMGQPVSENGLDPSVFRGLRSLGISISRIMDKGIVTHASKALSTSVDGINESASAIIGTDVGLEHTDRLKRLRLQPLEY